mmetsp:Transcript_1833/g.2826  ORF Transcript_1833/g.2826 Transcript_1833/m.2826 type:complete len:120 (+) Transcript_1833:1783-2142(+)
MLKCNAIRNQEAKVVGFIVSPLLLLLLLLRRHPPYKVQKKSNEGEENKQGKGPIQKYEHVVTCLKCKSELCAKRTAFLVSCPKCHSVSPNCGSNRTTTSVATAASATMNRVSSGSGLRA